MGYNNVPVNGWPQIKKLEELDALAKKIDNMPTFTSTDRAWLDEWESDLPGLAQDVSDLETDKANQVQIATVEESTTASQAYSAGDYLVLDGVLYKVTDDIAQDGTIVTEGEGKNVDLATVGGELSGLNSKLITGQPVYKGGFDFFKLGNVVLISKSNGSVDTDEEGNIQDDGEDLTVPVGFLPVTTINLLEAYASKRISIDRTTGKICMPNDVSATGVIVRLTGVYIVA